MVVLLIIIVREQLSNSFRRNAHQKSKGRFRDSNPGPPAPKAGIIPLDQTDSFTAGCRRWYLKTEEHDERANVKPSAQPMYKEGPM